MMTNTDTDDRVTMEDYLDDSDGTGEAAQTEPDQLPDDHDPYACEHCGRSFDHLGVRASKVRKKHEKRCPERDQDAE